MNAVETTTQLRRLWKLAFGDSEDFLDLFFSRIFSPERCHYLTRESQVAAALYWFDIECDNQKFAYLYAVATHPNHRGRGLCRDLMAETQDLLTAKDYAGILLVPQDDALRRMYRKMGYVDCTSIAQFSVPSGEPIPMTKLSPEEYGRLRKSMLPPHSVIQEGRSLEFLGLLGEFYVAEGFLATVSKENGTLRCLEYLGDPALAPGLVATLGCREGIFRSPGDQFPFAQYLPLKDGCPKPEYFAFAFD